MTQTTESSTSRVSFVKGTANVFLYRFQQFMSLHRGNGDMFRWITRFQLSVQRMQEAWNDTYLPITDPNNAEVRAFIAGLPADEQTDITAEAAMERANDRLRDQHARTTPITANLVALIFGYLDNHEGYWVEDEEDGAEGSLEADEDTFWVYDEENYTLVPEAKGRSKLADDQTDAWQGEGQWQDGQWHDQSWDDWSWYESEEAYAAKGKGKKGKKGKGKDGKSGSKDGTAQLADAAQSSTTTATTFYVDHLNSLNLSFMATTEEQTSFIAQPLTSTSMVLDLGCTRAMAVGSGHGPILMSLPQMRNLRFQFELHPDKALLSSSVLGIWDVKLKVAPSSHLVLDFLDLSRLIWNVRFDKHKKSSFLTYFKHYEYGFHQKTQGSSSQKEVPEKLAFAMDDEWVTDEANVELIRIHKQVRKAKYEPKDEFMPIPLEFLDTKRKTIMEFYRARVLSRKMVGVPVSFLRPSLLSLGKVCDPARDKKGSPEDIISKGKPEDSSERTGAAGSFPQGKVPARRRVRAKGSVPQGTEPKVAAPPVAPEGDPDLQDIDPSTEEVPRGAPEVSSLEPRRIALPLPGQEVSRASPQYQRTFEKLNKDVELHKLHVKHYHMNPAQLRRRTSMLGLPGEIYDKYDRIVKGCRVCSTSVPTPPRARIAGSRASPFGDLIFVDHEEIKFGNKAYLALVIIDGASNLLWATALTSLEAPETLGAFRQWTEESWRSSIFHRFIHGILQVPWDYSLSLWSSYSLAESCRDRSSFVQTNMVHHGKGRG
eukprot:s5128_g2.t2